MQALMLAAGKGSRLGRYTKDNTKCMLEVNGKTLLERCIDALKEANMTLKQYTIGTDELSPYDIKEYGDRFMFKKFESGKYFDVEVLWK